MWQEVAKLEQLEADQPLAISVDGRALLVVRTDQGLFALEDSCPHQKQPLSTGSAKGTKLTCRHHGIEIDLATGQVTWSMGFLGLDDVKVYPVREESGVISVEV